MPSPTVENYLKALHALTRRGEDVAISDLSEVLGISKPSANSMVKKLAERGLLRYERYRPLQLTEEGRKQAALVVRRHRLTEMFLVEKMGFGWEEVHPIAEQIEHVKSKKFFERMDLLLGSPTLDPHGSPIPDRQGNVTPPEGRPLHQCRAGEAVCLSGLTSSSTELLEYLNEKELQLGTKITIAAVERFDGSLTITYDGCELVISRETAGQLLVTPR